MFESWCIHTYKLKLTTALLRFMFKQETFCYSTADQGLEPSSSGRITQNCVGIAFNKPALHPWCCSGERVSLNGQILRQKKSLECKTIYVRAFMFPQSFFSRLWKALSSPRNLFFFKDSFLFQSWIPNSPKCYQSYMWNHAECISILAVFPKKDKT